MTTEQGLSELTGLFIALSGDVFDNSKLILGLPSKADFDQLTAYTAGQFNTISSDISTINDQIGNILAFIQNLNLAHSELETEFTGHTGVGQDATGSINTLFDVNAEGAAAEDHFVFDGSEWINRTREELTTTTVGAVDFYHVQSTEKHIFKNAISVGGDTVVLPQSPGAGQEFFVYDIAGNAATDNITIIVSGGAATINGTSSAIINGDYDTVSIKFNGSTYIVRQ